MICTVSAVKDFNEQRPLELINKTNQFNLNGKRISEIEWKSYFLKNNYVYKLHLKDKFSDHGIIGIIVCKKIHHKLIVESMVLSCRVFSRNIESIFLLIVQNLSKKLNVNGIDFKYKSTSKNILVENFFKKNLINNYNIKIKKFKIKYKFLGKINKVN